MVPVHKIGATRPSRDYDRIYRIALRTLRVDFSREFGDGRDARDGD